MKHIRDINGNQETNKPKKKNKKIAKKSKINRIK